MIAGCTVERESIPKPKMPEEEKLLWSLEKGRQALLLTEMNGEKCAGRQLWKLAVYDRPQKAVVNKS